MKETKEQWNKEHYQLTKAKEIIRELVEKVVWFDNCFDLKAEAEQFLNSGVEK